MAGIAIKALQTGILVAVIDMPDVAAQGIPQLVIAKTVCFFKVIIRFMAFICYVSFN